MKKIHAKYIWFDRQGQGRNIFAAFRHSFECTSAPALSAEIHVFADSAYQLFVNGNFVNFGPARFNPSAPEYDSYDISGLLERGRNSIAVLVNHYGTKTYKSINTRACFIAWGGVKFTDGGAHCLDTGTAKWQAIRYEAYDPDAPKFSFALNPMEIYRQWQDCDGWREKNFDDSTWPDAVELEGCDCWGELSPRTIPPLGGEAILPEKVLGVYPLKRDEISYSFRVPATDFFDRKPGETGKKFILFKFWIHSPCRQNVTAGLFWGEHWLNGKPLPERVHSDNSSLRYNHRLPLEKGWNFVFGSVGVYLDEFSFYINLPSDCGVKIRAEKKISSPFAFAYAGQISQEEHERIAGRDSLPLAPDACPPEIGSWKYFGRDCSAGNPGRENDLDFYGKKFEILHPQDLQGKIFKKSDYPDGLAIILDLGWTRLFRIEAEFEGVRGVTADFSFSERLRNRKLQLYLHHTYHASARIECARKSIFWRSFNPYGARYVALTFRSLSEDLKIKKLNFISATYPVERIGDFECSENVFNEIWRICQRTQESNMEDAYVDCPTRERGNYARDTIIQYQNNLAFFGDHRLMRRCLSLYAGNPAENGKFKAVAPTSADYTISDFSLNLVEGFQAYYLNSGDREFIKSAWNPIRKNLEWFEKLADENDGLLDFDWFIRMKEKPHYGGFHGDLSATENLMTRKGLSASFTFTYICALKSAQFLAELLGDAEKAEEYLSRRRKSSQRSLEAFWDGRENCFSDDLNRKTHSVQANLLSVNSGVAADGGRLSPVSSFLEKQLEGFLLNGYDCSKGVLVSAPYAFYLFEALYSLGLVKTAERIMVEGWGYMLSKGLKTCREYFERAHDSYCHAWSAHPAYYLSRHALGVSYPNAPDFSLVRICVKADRIKWARGTYPHPNGSVFVEWHSDSEGRRTFDVKAPDGVRVEIE